MARLHRARAEVESRSRLGGVGARGRRADDERGTTVAAERVVRQLGVAVRDVARADRERLHHVGEAKQRRVDVDRLLHAQPARVLVGPGALNALRASQVDQAQLARQLHRMHRANGHARGLQHPRAPRHVQLKHCVRA
eukprot:scaffold51573_cov33-Phaeocystis_antarctica.AAC.3